MRKVNLTMKEEMMYDIIKAVCLGKVSKQFAANKLNVTRRTINRRINDYKLNGKEAFSHKNKTKKPKTTIDLEVRQLIIELYKTKYYESNFIHFKQLLEREEMIIVSIGFIRNLMKEHKIISPLARRKTKREYLKQKKLMNKNSNSALIDSYTDKEVEYQLLLQSEAHPRKPRAKYAGETIQLDASVHYWIAGEKWYLHAAIDDATGNIVAAYFDKQETLKGYYNILFQILNNYGIPYEFVTDKRTVFEYKKRM